MHKMINNDAIPKKSDKIPVVKKLCEQIENEKGRKRVSVKIELDPFFDIRQQLKRAAPGSMGPMGPTGEETKIS